MYLNSKRFTFYVEVLNIIKNQSYTLPIGSVYARFLIMGKTFSTFLQIEHLPKLGMFSGTIGILLRQGKLEGSHYI